MKINGAMSCSSNLMGDDVLEVASRMRQTLLGDVEDGIVTHKDLVDDEDDDEDDDEVASHFQSVNRRLGAAMAKAGFPPGLI